jgi:hypothetical protein
MDKANFNRPMCRSNDGFVQISNMVMQIVCKYQRYQALATATKLLVQAGAYGYNARFVTKARILGFR